MIQPDSLIIVSSIHRRGRPPLSEGPTWPVSTRLPDEVMERLSRLSRQHDIPVSALVREFVQICLKS